MEGTVESIGAKIQLYAPELLDTTYKSDADPLTQCVHDDNGHGRQTVCGAKK
jgi:hypothetical protein